MYFKSISEQFQNVVALTKLETFGVLIWGTSPDEIVLSQKYSGPTDQPDGRLLPAQDMPSVHRPVPDDLVRMIVGMSQEDTSHGLVGPSCLAIQTIHCEP